MEEKMERQKRESSDRGTEKGTRLEGGKELEGGWVQRGEEELIGGFSLLAGGIRQPVQGLAIHHPPTASGSEIQHPPPPPPPPPPTQIIRSAKQLDNHPRQGKHGQVKWDEQ